MYMEKGWQRGRSVSIGNLTSCITFGFDKNGGLAYMKDFLMFYDLFQAYIYVVVTWNHLISLTSTTFSLKENHLKIFCISGVESVTISAPYAFGNPLL